MKKTSYIIISLLSVGLLLAGVWGWFFHIGLKDAPSYVATLSPQSITKTVPAFKHLVIHQEFPKEVTASFMTFKDFKSIDFKIKHSSNQVNSLTLPADIMEASSFRVQADTLFVDLHFKGNPFKNWNFKSRLHYADKYDIKSPEWYLSVSGPLLSVNYQGRTDLYIEGLSQDSLSIYSRRDIHLTQTHVGSLQFRGEQPINVHLYNTKLDKVYPEAQFIEFLPDSLSQINDYYYIGYKDSKNINLDIKYPCTIHWIPDNKNK